MSLQYKFFMIPARDSANSESELNRFLSSVRLITIHREFVSDGQNSFWGMAVEYVKDGLAAENAETASVGKKKVDYREVLSPDNFAIFSKLREWRKSAAALEDIPIYAVFTNEQLAKIAEKRITTKAAIGEIEGIGEARVKKYGEAVIGVIAESNGKSSENETKRQSVSSDSHV